MKHFVFFMLFVGLSGSIAFADVTPEQKETLAEIQKSLSNPRKLLKQKQYVELRAEITAIRGKLEELGIDKDEKYRVYKSIVRTLKSMEDKIPVSFEREIAPILKEKCVRCHGPDRRSGKLRFDTYYEMSKGGTSGFLVRGKSPRNSLLMARLLAKDTNLQMPKNGTRLPDDELLLISKWISQGAAFDGTDRTAEIGTSAMASETTGGADMKKIVIARPDGSETVSFKDDLAPWLVGSCLGCHSGNNPSSSYSMATFEGILKGGDRGEAVVPGDPDNSMLIHLTLRQKTPDGERLKMPQGNQRRIKQSQALMLETWVKEGAKFDGGDAKAPIRDLVPTPEEIEAKRLAAMSNSEFQERRLEQAKELWERVLPRDEVSHVTSEHFLVFASTEQRAKQISDWAERDIESIVSFFRFEGEPWRGRLAIFVAKDRFGYQEFNQVVFNRQTPAAMVSHSVVTPGFSQAYVVLQDIGDTVDEDSMGIRTSLTAQLAEAFVQRSGNSPPRVVSRGAGLWLASKAAGSDDPWFKRLPMRLKNVSVARGQDVFNDGSFSFSEMDAVAHALAGFMAKSGRAKYVSFVNALQSGQNLRTAAQRAYQQLPGDIGAAFMRR